MRDDTETQTVSMNDAIKFIEEDESGIFCEFQPGNGTRYLVGLTRLSDKTAQTRRMAGGLEEGGWIVTWINAKRCCVLQPDGFLSPHFLKNKLGGGSMADAVVLSRLIAYLTCREVEPWEPRTS